MKQLDRTTPATFMNSLNERARTLTESDFVSVHGLTNDSGMWGMCKDCAEVAKGNGVVLIRNSNDETKTQIVLADSEWEALRSAILSGAL